MESLMARHLTTRPLLWAHCLRRPFDDVTGDYTRWAVGSPERLPDI